MKNAITIQEKITVKANQEDVWDYSQNFNTRSDWDKSVLQCKVLAKRPYKLVQLKLNGGVWTKLKYKLCRRPYKTSLQMVDTKSLFIKGGGGSWTYKRSQLGTEWMQQNTLIVKNDILFFLLGWFIKRQLTRSTRQSMQKAKEIMEQHSKNTIK